MSLRIDESSGIQSDAVGTSNDISVLSNLGALVPEFDAVLTFEADPLAPVIAAGVTGATTTDTDGAPVASLSFDSGTTDVAFTLSSGNGTDSLLRTTDNERVLLYISQDNNNVCLGRKESDGSLVFAVYLDTMTAAEVQVDNGTGDPGATTAKVWMVQYQSLKHTDTSTPNDLVTLDGPLNLAVNSLMTFDLTNGPSGNNLFLMYGHPADPATSTPDVSLIVTSENAAGGGTVNTSQAGEAITIGTDNQMVVVGKGLYFTFVTDSDPQYTVPNLTHGEAVDPLNIDYGGLHLAAGAKFTVAQLQNDKAATVKVSAFNTVQEEEAAYIAGLGADTPVNITAVSVTRATYNKQTKETTTTTYDFAADTGIVNGPAGTGLSVDFTGATVIVKGAVATDVLEYTTAVDHNRVLIHNEGGAKGVNAAFDIGDFTLTSGSLEPLDLLALEFVDDGPSIDTAGTLAPLSVDESALGTDDSGSYAVNFTTVDYGADGAHATDPLVYSLGIAAGNPASGLIDTATGHQVFLFLESGVVRGREGTDAADAADNDVVFEVSVVATTGVVTLDQKRAVIHDPNNGPNDSETLTSASLVTLTATAKDFEGDTDTATHEIGTILNFVDDAPAALAPGDVTVENKAGEVGSAALGYIGKVGADVDGTVEFVGTEGMLLQGSVQDGSPTPENLKIGTSTIYLSGFGTDTLTAKTTDGDQTVFVMTLNPDGSVTANDLYDIAMAQKIANIQVLQFGSELNVDVSSGNTLAYLVENIGGSPIDALFSGWQEPGDTEQTVNISTTGVGIGNQSMGFNDRLQIQFLQDDGAHNTVVSAAEVQTVNQFKFTMTQNNSPADVGDALIEVFNADGTKGTITEILINGTNVLNGPVLTNDQPKKGGPAYVTAVSDGNGGYELHGLGGGIGGGDGSDNDTIEVRSTVDYARLDVTGIAGADGNTDTFDILINSVAISTPYDITFTVQAKVTDEDGDTTTPVDLDVTLDADGTFAAATLIGVAGIA